MNEFTHDAIASVVTKYLEGIAADVIADPSKLSEKQRDAWRRQAARILRSDVVKYTLRSLADQTKSILLLKSKGTEEMLVNRGFLLGLQAFERSLLTWAGPEAQAKRNDDDF